MCSQYYIIMLYTHYVMLFASYPLPPPCHSGHFGLWLDEDFLHGSSYNCETYGNRPLATTEDFLCTGIEAWGFGPGDS